MNPTTETQTGQLSGQLDHLAEIFTAVNLYTSTDPNRGVLQMAKISGNTIEVTDSYAALIYTITADTYTTTPETFTLPAAEITKALQAAAKLAGKRSGQITATITSTLTSWTFTTSEGQQISGNNTPHEWPNTATIWADTKTRPQAAPFEPFALAQWQIERLAKLAKLAGKDNTATLTHYSAPTKPMIYTTKTKHGHATALVMPAKITS
jgi:predicted Zn-dependent protease